MFSMIFTYVIPFVIGLTCNEVLCRLFTQIHGSLISLTLGAALYLVIMPYVLREIIKPKGEMDLIETQLIMKYHDRVAAAADAFGTGLVFPTLLLIFIFILSMFIGLVAMIVVIGTH